MNDRSEIQAAALAVEAVVKRLRSFGEVSSFFTQTTILTDGTYYQAGDTHYTDRNNNDNHVVLRAIPDSSDGWFGIYKPFSQEVKRCVTSRGLSYHGGASFVLRIDGVSSFESQIKTLICDYPPTVQTARRGVISTFDFWEERRKTLFPIGNVFLKYTNEHALDTIDVTRPVLIIYGEKVRGLDRALKWTERPYELIYLCGDINADLTDKVYNGAYAEKLERKEGSAYLKKIRSLPSALFDLLHSVSGNSWMTMGLFFVPTRSSPDTLTALMCPFGMDGVGDFKQLDSFYWELQSIIRTIGAGVETEVLLHKTKFQHQIASTKSAIGSIMSRNGSHNIGSHVLSALSHNVGTMPDDRVLYQYIQHRMDYIATATTEFPQWTTPTMFVAGLMKNFYSQKHLLDYISRSEGLRAYKFQERNLDEATRMNQHGTIRIFIRKFFELGRIEDRKELPPDHRYLTYDLNSKAWSIYYFFGEKDKMFRWKFSDGKRTEYEVSESGGTAKFLEYDERFTPDWKQDVKIAIPGGIVGQHAFYTIIENIIRNAAKHGWAAEQNLSEKDLEIFVDFHEKADEVVFTIGDNVSDVFGDAEQFWQAFFAWSERKKCKLRREQINEDCVFLKKWKTILNSVTGQLDAVRIRLEPDGGQIIKAAYESLKNWEAASDIVENAEKAEETRKLAEEVDGLLFRAFALPLNINDANKLEQYLRQSNKDLCDDKKIPLIYTLQRKFLQDKNEVGGQECWIVQKYREYLSSNAPTNNSETALGRRLILPLHHDQQRKLAQSFIDSSGKLRKANWGLAEMKISAGYLAQRSTEEIGGLSEKGNDIIVPIAMPGVCRNADNPHNCLVCSRRNVQPCYDADQDCPLKKHHFHLGYRFSIAKPRDILLVLDWQLPNAVDAELRDFISVFGGEGIDFAYANVDVFNRPGNDGKEQAFVKCSCRRVSCNGELEGLPIGKFNYRYVILPNELPEKLRGEAEKIRALFSFRCVSHADVVFLKEQIESIVQEINCDEISIDKLFRKCVASADSSKLNYSECDAENQKHVAVFRRAVQSAWLRKLASERYGKQYSEGNCPVKLIVNVEGGENGSERGLVTTADLLRTMFVECYHTALISFLKNPPRQLVLGETTKRLVALLSLIKVMPDKMETPQQDYGHGADFGAKEFIRKQLVSYCGLLKSHLLLSAEFIDALESMEKYGQDLNGKNSAFVARKIEDIEKNFEKAIARRLLRGRCDEDQVVREGCEDLISWLRKMNKPDLDGLLDAFHGDGGEYNFPERQNACGTRRHCFEDNLKAVITACSVPEEDEFEALVESLNSMFLASDVYLRKYEERIATLPEAYKHDGCGKASATERKENNIQDIADSLMLAKAKEGAECKVVKYSRHDHAMPKDGIYSEALSGSQSYLNALSRLVLNQDDDEIADRYAAVARLIENAFLRILVIDERVMNFVNDHRAEEMALTFINMGIWVADVEHQQPSKPVEAVKDGLYRFDLKDMTDEDACEKRHSTFTDIPADAFDILVIHQGIIEKWLERRQKPKEESEVVKILKDLRCSIPRVVVTTGRGRPENIPASEKVLPFSVVEFSLFKRYPEKLNFVNTLMSLLPYGENT